MSYHKNNHITVPQTTVYLTAYNPKARLALTFPEDSPYTKQEFKDECDINILLSRYMSTGEIPNLNERAPQYLDVTGMDFQTHMEFVAGAQTLFQELPSAIRNRFSNSPAEFLDFCSQEKNRPEMAEMGLLKPPAEWATPPTPPAAPAAPEAPAAAPAAPAAPAAAP